MWISVFKDICNPCLSFGLQTETAAMVPSTWSQITCLQNIHILSSARNAGLCSNFNVPSYSDSHFYQPATATATVHGYHLSKYLSGMNASGGAHSRIPICTPGDFLGLLNLIYLTVLMLSYMIVTRDQNVLGSLELVLLSSRSWKPNNEPLM